MVLTKKQQAHYIAHPWRCPYCNSQNIEAGHFDGEAMTVPVVCRDCGKKWVDHYELTSIKEVI